MRPYCLRSVSLVLSATCILLLSADGQASVRYRAESDDPAPCTDKIGWTPWEAIYTDPNGNGRIEVSYRTGSSDYEGERLHSFRFCNRFDVPVSLSVNVITESRIKSGMGAFTIKPNSTYREGGQWTICKSINGFEVTTLTIGGRRVPTTGKSQNAGECPRGKICVPAELTFPGPKKPEPRRPGKRPRKQ